MKFSIELIFYFFTFIHIIDIIILTSFRPLNIIIKLLSTDINPIPSDSVKYVSFQLLYRGQSPPESYFGDPNFVYVPKFEVQSPNEILLRDVRLVSHMADLRKKIFAGSEFDMKEKPKFNLIIKVWSGQNYSSIDIPFRINSTKTPLDGIEGEREVTISGSINVLNADSTPLLDSVSFNMQLLRNTKKRTAPTPLKSNAHPEKKRRISDTNPFRSVPFNGYLTPHSINFQGLKAIIDCDSISPLQPISSQIIVTAESNTKLRLQTDTGILVSLDIFNPLPEDLPSKFIFCENTVVSGVSPTSIPTNFGTVSVTITGLFPFHNVLGGKFDVLFGELSCVSIQKITATQIIVLPPSHLPATVEIRVFFTDEKGERVQIPAENDINPKFTYTDERSIPSNQNIFVSSDPLGITRLHRVCASGDIHTVIACLSHKESPFQTDNFGWTSFHRACAARQLAICKLLFLVTQGLIIEYPDYRGLSALSLPALEGDVHFVTAFWNWVREVRQNSVVNSTPTFINGYDSDIPLRPVLPPPQIPSVLTPDNEYRRSFIAGCAIAELYLPKADVNLFRLMSYDDSPLQFNILRGTTVLFYNKPMKLFSPHRNVKGILLCINHPHFSRKESHPVYYGYSSDYRKIQTMSNEIGIIDRDLQDSSILLPALDDIEIPPFEQLYSAYGKPAVYFSLYVDIFLEDSLDKMNVLRFDIPILYEVNLPEEDIGTQHRILKEGTIQDYVELQNPSVLVANTSVFHQIVHPFHDLIQLSHRTIQVE